MRIKPGVRIRGLRPEILWAVCVIDKIYGRYGAEAVITSGTEGKHSRGSLHYSGNAVDLRTKNLSGDWAKAIVREAIDALGPDFDIVLEHNHIHMEYQPHEE